MNWTNIENEQIWQEAQKESHQQKVLIFKHSTRCPISAGALRHLEKKWQENDNQKVKPYFLDLIQYRDLSKLIEQESKVRHESPQAIVLDKGEVVYHNSHSHIIYEDIVA